MLSCGLAGVTTIGSTSFRARKRKEVAQPATYKALRPGHQSDGLRRWSRGPNDHFLMSVLVGDHFKSRQVPLQMGIDIDCCLHPLHAALSHVAVVRLNLKSAACFPPLRHGLRPWWGRRLSCSHPNTVLVSMNSVYRVGVERRGFLSRSSSYPSYQSGADSSSPVPNIGHPDQIRELQHGQDGHA